MHSRSRANLFPQRHVLQCRHVHSGPIAQLGERRVRNAEVEGSNPFRSTGLFLASFGHSFFSLAEFLHLYRGIGKSAALDRTSNRHTNLSDVDFLPFNYQSDSHDILTFP